MQRAVLATEIFAKIEQLGVTHLCGAPTVLNMLAFSPGSNQRRLRYLAWDCIAPTTISPQRLFIDGKCAFEHGASTHQIADLRPLPRARSYILTYSRAERSQE